MAVPKSTTGFWALHGETPEESCLGNITIWFIYKGKSRERCYTELAVKPFKGMARQTVIKEDWSELTVTLWVQKPTLVHSTMAVSVTAIILSQEHPVPQRKLSCQLLLPTITPSSWIKPQTPRRTKGLQARIPQNRAATDSLVPAWCLLAQYGNHI